MCQESNATPTDNPMATAMYTTESNNIRNLPGTNAPPIDFIKENTIE
jgi:hypothetical protein